MKNILFGLAAAFLCLGEALCQEKRIALVYTVTTPELKADVVRALHREVGDSIRLLEYEVPEVFHAIRSAGRPTPEATARLIGTYMQAVEDSADVVLNICSTTGDIARRARSLMDYIGVPLVNVNDEMCRQALRLSPRIAIVATFPTSIAPTRRTLRRLARAERQQVRITEVVVDGGFGMDSTAFQSLLKEKLKDIRRRADVILFTQGSMAYCEEFVERETGLPVLTNPVWSAREVRRVLEMRENEGKY